MNESNHSSITNDITVNNDYNDDLGNEDAILDEKGDDTNKSLVTKNRDRQVGKRVSSSKRVALILQHKVKIINYYDSTKDSLSKPILSMTHLGVWAKKCFEMYFRSRQATEC